MRTIRFRGKSITKFGYKVINIGDWIYGGISMDYDRVWIDTEYYGQIIVDKETVGQFTGLHDKNGKEIYETDIVYVASEDENAVISWDKETARYIIQFKDCCADFDNYYGKELEVIGNIYDNKNLLEEG